MKMVFLTHHDLIMAFLHVCNGYNETWYEQGMVVMEDAMITPGWKGNDFGKIY